MGMAGNVLRNLQALGQDANLLTNHNSSDIVKERFVDITTNHMFLRVDSESEINRIQLSNPKLEADLIIISDYNKGFLEEEDIMQICQNNPLVFLDTKKRIGDWAENATFLKINNHEYRRSLPFIEAHLLDRTIRTVGPGGAVFRGKEFHVKSSSVIDVSGAGDTFMAGLAHEYLVSQDIEKAIVAANQLASEVVTLRGMALP
jgi:bifunctional ADP-heptose synthase (sugar kinase/adenylyltransferase)